MCVSRPPPPPVIFNEIFRQLTHLYFPTLHLRAAKDVQFQTRYCCAVGLFSSTSIQRTGIFYLKHSNDLFFNLKLGRLLLETRQQDFLFFLMFNPNCFCLNCEDKWQFSVMLFELQTLISLKIGLKLPDSISKVHTMSVFLVMQLFSGFSSSVDSIHVLIEIFLG